MSEAANDFDPLVRSKFAVRDVFHLPEGEVEYKVEYSPDSKDAFARLYGALEPKGLTPWLTGTKEDCVLTVRKRTPLRPSKSRLPVILALLTLAAIVFYAILERVVLGVVAPEISGSFVFIGSAISVALVLGAREVAHRLAAARAGSPPNRSFLLPGIPGVTAFLPSLGFASVQRAPALNRDRHFLAMIAGPVAMLGASALLQFLGGYLSYPAEPLNTCQVVNSLVSACPSNPSVIQAVLASGTGFLTHLPLTGTVASPLEDASSVGFLLAALSILPMASFDGGHMASTALSPRAARVGTYLSVLLMILLDATQGRYWVIAIVVLVLAGRPLQVQLLDEVSEISGPKRAVFLLMLVVAVLCFPIPQDVGTFVLG